MNDEVWKDINARGANNGFEKEFKQQVAGKIDNSETVSGGGGQVKKKIGGKIWALIVLAFVAVAVLIAGIIIQIGINNNEVEEWSGEEGESLTEEEELEREELLGQWDCGDNTVITFYWEGEFFWQESDAVRESTYTLEDGVIRFDGWEGAQEDEQVIVKNAGGSSMTCDKIEE